MAYLCWESTGIKWGVVKDWGQITGVENEIKGDTSSHWSVKAQGDHRNIMGTNGLKNYVSIPTSGTDLFSLLFPSVQRVHLYSISTHRRSKRNCWVDERMCVWSVWVCMSECMCVYCILYTVPLDATKGSNQCFTFILKMVWICKRCVCTALWRWL